MKINISVVVPVYNVEGYVEKCINSILEQTYNNFELLLIDDGSTDDSGKICEKYSENYENVKTFHKHNGGLSDARNFGMKQANGRYFAFIDADDYVDSCYLEILYKMINEFKVQISCVNSIREYPSSGERFSKLKKIAVKYEKINRTMAYHKMLIREDFSDSAWGKLYDRELFEDVEFPKGKLFEDLLTIPYIFEKCHSVAFSNIQCYHYVKRSSSIVNRKLSEKDLSIFKYLDGFESFIMNNYPELFEEFSCFYITVILNIILERMILNGASKKELNFILKKNDVIWKCSLKNKYLNNKRKLETLLVKNCPILFGILLKKWNKLH